MAVQDEPETVPAEVDHDAGAPRKAMTIGAVCKALEQEFPDISISKIRYLEDQKLLAPRRTPGGYRLYSGGDVQRLRTILRLQRDEFLPLRVIRQELASGRAGNEVEPASDGAGASAGTGAARRKRNPSVTAPSSAAPCTRWRTSSRRRAPSRGWSQSSRSTASSRARSAPAPSTSTRPSARSCAR